MISCQDKNDDLLILDQSLIKTVTEKEALDYFASKVSHNSTKSSDIPYVTPHLESIWQENIINSNELLTIVFAATIHKKHYSRILLLKIKNEIKSVVFSMYPSENSTNKNFTGEILITDMDGHFIEGYRVNNGCFISKFNRNYKSSNKRLKKTLGSICPFHEDGDPSCILSIQELNEYEVFARSPNHIVYLSAFDFEMLSSEVSGSGLDIFEWNYDTGGSGDIYPTPNTCPIGYALDKDGKCVKKPCTGNPVQNPEIAPQKKASGIKGGMYGCTRFNSLTICEDIIGLKKHDGIDIRTNYGDPIYAMYDGTSSLGVQKDHETGAVVGAGYYVYVTSIIQGERVNILYAHLQESNRISGSVNAGDIIGYQGDSGNLKDAIRDGFAESHLHLKIKLGNKAIDPNIYLSTKFDPITGQIIQTQSNCN